MKLDDIYIILCNPDESRNVGSVCRAMKNMGIKNLRIVGDSSSYNEEQIKVLSVHAFDIWQNAQFFSSIKDAASDCSIIAGTTRRRGKKRKEWLMFPEEFVSHISSVDAKKIAVVFGNERTGLTDSELNECTLGVNIPSSKEFGSLNLSHAVQIMCYLISRNLRQDETGYTPVSMKRIDETVSIISDGLSSLGFFKIAGKPEMENFWRSVLSRAALSENEEKYMEHIFSKISGLANKQQSEDES